MCEAPGTKYKTLLLKDFINSRGSKSTACLSNCENLCLTVASLEGTLHFPVDSVYILWAHSVVSDALELVN